MTDLSNKKPIMFIILILIIRDRDYKLVYMCGKFCFPMTYNRTFKDQNHEKL